MSGDNGKRSFRYGPTLARGSEIRGLGEVYAGFWDLSFGGDVLGRVETNGSHSARISTAKDTSENWEAVVSTIARGEGEKRRRLTGWHRLGEGESAESQGRWAGWSGWTHGSISFRGDAARRRAAERASQVMICRGLTSL